MPSVCRRIVVLLVVALIGVGGPVASAIAQSGGGAGDQQYEDPFGGSGSSGSSGSGSSGSGRSGSSGTSDSDAQPLTQAPQSSGSGSSGTRSSGSGSGTSTPSTSGTATAAPSTQASGTLPNTGLDARVLVLAGVVLVVAGIGLRMRNAPERF
ncbi:LPXTG cell wall anchor domain-containing protein [Conexibacter woesei]|uniref:LPXTG cell wall anchor domain-containing protein n=1 Tax=Conexibacter woesei TaxID=191495 RepID=UPI00047EEB5A|nr:LPXTG cell wall anchor domain-containing protein [Conexibacter woesei]